MRRKDKEIVDEKVMISIIEKAIVCRVAMCWQDEPYVIPISFSYPVISRPKPDYPDEIVPRLPGNFAESCYYFCAYFSPFYHDDEMLS